MNQLEFAAIKVDDEVLTIYKGHVIKARVQSIFDKGDQKRCVILVIPESNKTILKHMYGIYCQQGDQHE